MNTHITQAQGLGVLAELFGDNRAEWPPERFRELFVQPSYFSKLESKRPALLVGGRGTGKTTTLRSLRYDATFERLTAQGQNFSDQSHLGVFIRANKNHVRAFQGGGISDQTWVKAFAHYFNLLVARELSDLAAWLEVRQVGLLSSLSLQRVCRDLALTTLPNSLPDLKSAIDDAISSLQLFVNNPRNAPTPLFSMAEAPIATFATRLAEDGLTEGRVIFCCVDEYENLLDDQQAILNTYIKHAQPPLSYKIGVRQKGLRTHRTIDSNDLLQNPDDYRLIEIAEEGFEQFATEVAQLRLRRAREKGVSVPGALNEFLKGLTFDQEASLLGADRVAEDVLTELLDTPQLYEIFSAKRRTETYFLRYWADSEARLIADLAADWVLNEAQWTNRINNYGYASLFWLSKGRKGVRIRKYYCGERVLLALAGGNIRYFLELIDAALAQEGAFVIEDGVYKVTEKAQTLGAKTVGQRRLNQLEGLAERGIELKRLVLAIGKVFFELARTPLGRTPEVTSFVLSGGDSAMKKIVDLLNEGVAHLAFEAAPRTKATTEFEMKDDEYRLHPIFCAFFEISHRRKRRTVFKAENLLEILSDKPGKAISEMLDGTVQSPTEELPEQLALFTTFFSAMN